jgi:hypothetical protein
MGKGYKKVFSEYARGRMREGQRVLEVQTFDAVKCLYLPGLWLWHPFTSIMPRLNIPFYQLEGGVVGLAGRARPGDA